MNGTAARILFTVSVMAATATAATATAASGQAAGRGPRFERVAGAAGRSLGFVASVEQDSAGFLWLATRGGLLRYDGYGFERFGAEPGGGGRLPFSDVTYQRGEPGGGRWVRHYDRLHLLRDDRLAAAPDSLDQRRYSPNTQISLDRAGRHWIGPDGPLLHRRGPAPSDDATYRCQANAPHPLLARLALQGQGPSLLPRPGGQGDTAATFDLDAAALYVVAASGEGNGRHLFDYATISAGGREIWRPDPGRCHTDDAAPLFYTQIDTLTLGPGRYTLSFARDDGDTFDTAALGALGRGTYGIRLSAVPDTALPQVRRALGQPHFDSLAVLGSAIHQLADGPDGQPWVATDRAILRYDTASGRFAVEQLFGRPARGHVAMAFGPGGALLYCHGDTLRWSRQGRQGAIALPRGAQALCLLEDSRGDIWVGTRDGLLLIEGGTRGDGQCRRITADDHNRLYGNQIWSLCEDRSRNLWIGTSQGLNKYTRPRFDLRDLGQDRYAARPAHVGARGEVRTLAGRGEWTTVWPGGGEDRRRLPDTLFARDPVGGGRVYELSDIAPLGAADTLAIATGGKLALVAADGRLLATAAVAGGLPRRLACLGDTLWAACDDALVGYPRGLGGGPLARIPHPTPPDDTRGAPFALDIAPLRGRRMAVRTAAEIYVADLAAGLARPAYAISDEALGTASALGDLAPDGDTAVWFMACPTVGRATAGGLDFAVELELGDEAGDARLSLSGDTLLAATDNGLLVISGLAGLARGEATVARHGEGEGLADDNVAAAARDSRGNIWAATLRGLTVLEAGGAPRTIFGPQSATRLGFTAISAPAAPGLKTALQTTRGVAFADLDSANPFEPPVAVTELLLFGSPLECDSAIWRKRKLTLTHRQNFLTFGFAALDYTQPQRNRYRYRLANYNDAWTPADANSRRAVFTGLPPGSYVFEVEGSNNDGVWSGRPRRLAIEITPPWHRTAAAYAAYALLAALLVTGYSKWHEARLIRENRKLEASVRERTREVNRQKEEIAQKNRDITDSIRYALRIQTALLPAREAMLEALPSHFVLWLPRDIVSGDYYWISRAGHLTVAAAADCTGHGIPGAFMSMLGVAFLNDLVMKEEIITSDTILNELRHNITKALKQTGARDGSKDGMDIALCVIDHRTLRAQYSGANNPLVLVRGGRHTDYKADKMPIGYHLNMEQPFGRQEIDLQVGDRLYMYSDGYPDQFGGPRDTKFLSRNLKRLLVDTAALPMEEQRGRLEAEIRAWIGHGQQTDDILVFGIEITAGMREASPGGVPAC